MALGVLFHHRLPNRRRADRLGHPASERREGLARPVARGPRQPPHPRPPCSSSQRRAGAEGDATLVFALPSPVPSREYLLRVFGRSGIRVLFASDARNAQDCMRLAVIALLRDWPEDARPWLRRAEEAYHPQATELLNRPKHRELAAHLAYQYGQDFQQQRPGHLSMAMFFYRLAGDSGHTEAAYQLGCAHRSRGEPWVAAGWFRRAALDGHPAAIAEFTGAADQLTDSHTDRHNA